MNFLYHEDMAMYAWSWAKLEENFTV